MSETIIEDLSLGDKVIRLLSSNPDEKFTAKQIAEWIFKHYKNECLEKQARSTARITPIDSEGSLIQQLAAEIGAQRPRMQKKCKEIKTTEFRPRKYYYSSFGYEEEVTRVESQADNSSVPQINEHSLYPILKKFMMDEFGIYSKRIDEQHSINTYGKGANKWLHPDLVGVEVLNSGWKQEVRECATGHGDKKCKLWSFEVKLILNRSNVREAFFQAVSNSSWANIGYLVTSNLEGMDTEGELRMLSGLHGIGLIHLNVENLSESQILIPAKERSSVDWDIVNRMAVENKDFVDYISLVRDFYKLGYMRPVDWQNKAYKDGSITNKDLKQINQNLG